MSFLSADVWSGRLSPSSPSPIHRVAAPGAGGAILLETGGAIELETGGNILLEV